MKAKKIICLILCLVLSFSLFTIPFRVEAEAASLGTIVLAIVGSFIISSGISFSTKGIMEACVSEFIQSDGYEYAQQIHQLLSSAGDIVLGGMGGHYDLGVIVRQPWFFDFWESIQNFFGDGKVEINNSSPAPRNGYSFYNGFELPYFDLNTLSKDYAASSIFTIIYFADTNSYNLYVTSSPIQYIVKSEIITIASNCYGYSISSDNWEYTSRLYEGHSFATPNACLIWTSSDIFAYQTYSASNTSSVSSYLALAASSPVSEGQENYDVIGVYNNGVHTAEDIIASWARTAENGGAIDWALDSSSVYQDITSADKDAPITSTQTDVLTHAGVEVQTKDESIEKYKVNLKSVFPFCIPFDIYNFFNILVAEREAPVFDFNLDFGKYGSHPITVDLSDWETVATILRTIELLAFCVGLALVTSKVIKW